MREVEMMRAYLDVVDRYAKVASDPATSGIAAVIAARDTLKPRGADAAIDYFTKLLPEVKNDSVARCIRAQLADLYKQAGQQDKALDQLHALIVDTPNEKPR
jgi:thioredoxin-like negative regulator of GroEL